MTPNTHHPIRMKKYLLNLIVFPNDTTANVIDAIMYVIHDCLLDIFNILLFQDN